MKLNGAVIQDMINNLLSLGQVITVARLRMQDHIYIEPIKLHTKRMTTSIFAGRAAHDCKSERFTVRRVVFELFTDTLGPVTSSKHSSTYRENRDTRYRNAIVLFITTSSMRQSVSGMRRVKIQADEFRDTVINKPGTGHSDRPTKPVLRVPCLASEYCIHQAYKAPHCV